ncbi:glycosyltransferase family 2 protein [Maliponia aquimaris]|uniref:N-acetylglucosaminyl-diphospho-decaprenol L-rhamnosyltransferase n=1 Tax=Maliponia aquimaris TaxID=1673631 RepID=A0A238JQG2_9RHOB|nr:glycosyltransferase family 2 protein [Maliponia aquimaris]SMX32900.1 N-acetylglucosaminyl-diphospho-decaprenol L-rhamnosyltransferase [Maliponia aquimaris]
MARILVVSLNYRTAEMTLRSVRAALAAMQGLEAELVIVDNASGDGSCERIVQAVRSEGWAQVRVVPSGHNGGFGAGNNVGIRARMADGSAPDYVYLLNSDAFPAPDAIRRLHDHLEAHPEAGFAGSYIHGEDGAAHMTAFRFPSLWSEFEGAARFGPVSRLLRNRKVPIGVPQATRRVDWLAGASIMMRQGVLDRIGLFDETFFLYFEETDLCLRAARAGYQTHYVRDSHVAHIGSVSTGMKTWARIPGYWLDSRWHYFSKNHGRGYAALATLMHALGGAFWRLRMRVQGKRPADPPHFLRDLLIHDLKALVRPLPRPRTTARVRAAPELEAE